MNSEARSKSKVFSQVATFVAEAGAREERSVAPNGWRARERRKGDNQNLKWRRERGEESRRERERERERGSENLVEEDSEISAEKGKERKRS